MPLNIDMAELDRLMIDSGPKVIATAGFTLNDMMARYGMNRSTAERRIQALITSGDIEEIGIRPGKGPQRVYRIVTPAAQTAHPGPVSDPVQPDSMRLAGANNR